MASSVCLSVQLPAAEPAQHLLCFSTRTSAPPANRMPSKTLSPSPTGLCSWLVLMLIFHALSGSSDASPVAKANREDVDLKSCLSASQQLLKVVNNSWLQLQEDVALAFNCTYEDMEIDDIMEETAHTITGCLENTSLMV
ncbi:hypothetical protein NDU88_001187 [Pleurodeles waltl]|uniref:Interleukin-12 subunit alpha n=1 Tax=Pleurodeles waltl TaxID=8319 RepID=A0AAV7LA97_PLEWA|nr:hypothetical protein NDU88_001187 [Pleurodeles waltl]